MWTYIYLCAYMYIYMSIRIYQILGLGILKRFGVCVSLNLKYIHTENISFNTKFKGCIGTCRNLVVFYLVKLVRKIGTKC